MGRGNPLWLPAQHRYGTPNPPLLKISTSWWVSIRSTHPTKKLNLMALTLHERYDMALTRGKGMQAPTLRVEFSLKISKNLCAIYF
ncbi:hypothetical protein PN36_02320 [Candidatus Thiomargarita nelsonii]|uniref:Uncharacterized protein n=1 Tax=Candidatus Thiomargarita nelsonii TaxID=1003181 RepID=A0A4E0QST4_9GAMM|nr:hypothetical protein PN36_02320 [Candidatus Thiomargarita nelsonii]